MPAKNPQEEAGELIFSLVNLYRPITEVGHDAVIRPAKARISQALEALALLPGLVRLAENYEANCTWTPDAYGLALLREARRILNPKGDS